MNSVCVCKMNIYRIFGYSVLYIYSMYSIYVYKMNTRLNHHESSNRSSQRSRGHCQKLHVGLQEYIHQNKLL